MSEATLRKQLENALSRQREIQEVCDRTDARLATALADLDEVRDRCEGHLDLEVQARADKFALSRALAEKSAAEAEVERLREFIDAGDREAVRVHEAHLRDNDALRQRAEAAEAKLARCGQENCMGWRLDENANWVREEVATELRAKLSEAQQRAEAAEAERLSVRNLNADLFRRLTAAEWTQAKLARLVEAARETVEQADAGTLEGVASLRTVLDEIEKEKP